MGQLQVLFDLPESVQQGLETGDLQRVGGVIVKRGTKQVVAWLRDSQVLEATIGESDSPLFQMIFTAAQQGLSLLDNRLTAETGSAIVTAKQVTPTGQLINVALTAATFKVIIQRLDRLSAEIEALGDRILAEFDRDRDIRFKIALQAARDVFETQVDRTRESAMRPAIDGLYEARENFLTDYQAIMANGADAPHLHLAQHYLIRALYAEMSRIRCYLVSGDADLAKRRLNEDLPLFEQHMQQLVMRWLGTQPAIYFHPELVSMADLDRFFRIQQWLRGISQDNQPTVMFRIIDELRGQFWNDELLKDEYASFFHRLSGRPRLTLAERRALLRDNLTQAEIVIENYERLLGFDLEVRSMRLSFGEWGDLAPMDAESLIFDSDALQITQWDEA